MDQKVALKIRLLANELNRKVAEMLKDDSESSSGIQMRMLNFIHRRNAKHIPVYQKDIEQEFDVRRSTATGVLQRMENRLLIERTSCAADNRFKTIYLTKSGQQQVEKNITKLHAFDKQLAQGISKNELMLFFELVEKISDNCKQIEKEG